MKLEIIKKFSLLDPKMTSKCSLKLKWTQEPHASGFDAKFEHFQVTSIDNGKLSFS